MRYAALKVGTKYISCLKDTSKIKLTSNKDEAVLWPMDMQPMLEEGVENLIVQGHSPRVVMIEE